ncbi:MAG: type II secretion system protein, partial [Deltaproteobacteria bacterium]
MEEPMRNPENRHLPRNQHEADRRVRTRGRRKRERNQAFSLIELMIVLAIAGIVLSVGIPNYLMHRDTAVLENEKMVLLDIRLNIEKYIALYDRVPTAAELAAEFYSGGFPFGYSYAKIEQNLVWNEGGNGNARFASLSPFHRATRAEVLGDWSKVQTPYDLPAPVEVAAHDALPEPIRIVTGAFDPIVGNLAITAGKSKKVWICHVPPGNPSNARSLRVGEPALSGHLNNHPYDCLGKC